MSNINSYFGEAKFRVWCQKVLPTIYDDSLSYYELICKVLKVMQDIANEVAEVEGKLDGKIGADYIYIGETKLTEEQVTMLLNLL